MNEIISIKGRPTEQNRTENRQFLDDFYNALYGNPNFQESYKETRKMRAAICFFQDSNFFSFICYEYAGYTMESLRIAAINKKGRIVPQESLVIGHSNSGVNVVWLEVNNPGKDLDSPEKRAELLVKLKGDYPPAA